MSKFISKTIVKGASFTNMKNRINYFKVAPKAFENVMGLEQYCRKASVDRKLGELIKIRVSQINGCHFCLNMHTKAAKKLKVTDEEIEQIKVWQESSLFDDKDKIAFELAERVTQITEGTVDDELYQQVREHYNEQEYVDLILIINQINMWNRISISMGNVVK